METKSAFFNSLAEENQKISNALKSVGYDAIKIDISQIGNAKNGTVDIHIWARSEEKN